VEVAGEDGDEIRALVFIAGHFSALFIDTDRLAIGIADVGDEQVVVEILAVISQPRGLRAIRVVDEGFQENLERVFQLPAHEW
jgi:hypothetical protein